MFNATHPLCFAMFRDLDTGHYIAINRMREVQEYRLTEAILIDVILGGASHNPPVNPGPSVADVVQPMSGRIYGPTNGIAQWPKLWYNECIEGNSAIDK